MSHFNGMNDAVVKFDKVTSYNFIMWCWNTSPLTMYTQGEDKT